MGKLSKLPADTEAADLRAILKGVEIPEGWKEQGLCFESFSLLFFGPEEEDLFEAAKICQRCPVRLVCLTSSLALTPPARFEYEGVWGGYVAEQRRAFRRVVLGKLQERREKQQAKTKTLVKV